MNPILSGQAGAAASQSYIDNATIIQQRREMMERQNKHQESENRKTDQLVSQGQSLVQANDRVKDLAEENKRYKEMLARPLAEILQENADMKRAYEDQQRLVLKWLLSQRCMKKVAIDLGKNQGLNESQVFEMCNENEVKVLDEFSNLDGVISENLINQIKANSVYLKNPT